MKTSVKSFSVFVALLAFLFVAPLQAQQTGSIAGNVTDPDGAAIAQAHVTLHRASSDLSRDTVTDAQGRFEFRRPLHKFLIEVSDFVLAASSLFHLSPKAIAGLAKIFLHSASNGGEEGNDDR